MRPTENSHWQALLSLQETLLAQEAASYTNKQSVCGITLDLSRQKINQPILEELLLLAESSNLSESIESLFNGATVNYTEQRAALHTALRDPRSHGLWVDGQDLLIPISETRQRLFDIAHEIRNHSWTGVSGNPITDVVNIGMGGSDLGPRFCTQALKKFQQTPINFHFVSDADPNAFESAVEHLTPEQTLFLISSKSFTTPETLYNYQKARQWLDQELDWTRHFIAITANCERAKESGFQHILPIWLWVGGRFSVTSAMNLITAIAIGPEAFQQFLEGAYAMDCHFRNTPFYKNLPVLAALTGIWNINFLKAHQHLILTYDQALDGFVQYVQQLDMESNGKSIDIYGRPVNYSTGPVVWGGPGNQAQHSYYQLLCQGTHQIAIDLISTKDNQGSMINTLCQNKSDVLYYGVQTSHSFEQIKGGASLTHIQLEQISPYALGALIALYEHKIFTQSVIWQINPFDQPGVETAKRFLQKKPANALVD